MHKEWYFKDDKIVQSSSKTFLNQFNFIFLSLLFIDNDFKDKLQ